MNFSKIALTIGAIVVGTTSLFVMYGKYKIASDYSNEFYPVCISKDNKVTTTPTFIEKLSFYYDSSYKEYILDKSRISSVIDNSIIEPVRKTMVHYQRGFIETKLSGYNFSYFDELNTDPIKEVCKYGYSMTRQPGRKFPNYGFYSIKCITHENGSSLETGYSSELPLDVPELLVFSSGGFKYEFCPSNISTISTQSDQSKVIAFSYSKESVRDKLTKDKFIEGLNTDIVVLANKIKESLSKKQSDLKTLIDNRKSWSD